MTLKQTLCPLINYTDINMTPPQHDTTLITTNYSLTLKINTTKNRGIPSMTFF